MWPTCGFHSRSTCCAASPDWRYELIDGQAVLSPRPRPLPLRRTTTLPLPPAAPVHAEVRALDLATDRGAVTALLVDTWSREDPYRSLDAPAELLRSEVEQGLDTAEFGVVAIDAGAVRAVALVHADRSDVPMLSWLTVARDARERGLATALLQLVTTTLHDRGTGELASATSSANVPSLRWHLSRGFQLADRPGREALHQSTIGPGLGNRGRQATA